MYFCLKTSRPVLGSTKPLMGLFHRKQGGWGVRMCLHSPYTPSLSVNVTVKFSDITSPTKYKSELWRSGGMLLFLFRVGKERRNILHEIRKRKANWIGHILRRNCLLQRVIEGKIKGGIEVTGRRGRRRRKLLYDLKERRGYFHLKEEALNRTMWRAQFGRGFGPAVRQIAKWIWYSWIRAS